ncbi:MAG TPA: hypothetical protein VKP30_28330 [Polyangiaceae bacterium]|nr:hypothetical protein [Polyangiaceae bacterium]
MACGDCTAGGVGSEALTSAQGETGDLPSKASRSTELAEEMEQLTRLRSLATSDPAAALRLSEQGDQRFVKGLFRQERQAIAIQSLAQLHRTGEAKQRARAFATAYPHSQFLARMSQLLGNDNE